MSPQIRLPWVCVLRTRACVFLLLLFLSSINMEDAKTLPPPPAGEVMEPVESVDPKLTVMGGSDSQKASDYANCESRT